MCIASHFPQASIFKRARRYLVEIYTDLDPGGLKISLTVKVALSIFLCYSLTLLMVRTLTHVEAPPLPPPPRVAQRLGRAMAHRVRDCPPRRGAGSLAAASGRDSGREPFHDVPRRPLSGGTWLVFQDCRGDDPRFYAGRPGCSRILGHGRPAGGDTLGPSHHFGHLPAGLWAGDAQTWDCCWG